MLSARDRWMTTAAGPGLTVSGRGCLDSLENVNRLPNALWRSAQVNGPPQVVENCSPHINHGHREFRGLVHPKNELTLPRIIQT
jgi:hypothetical protein